jgi:hypothetical protein
MDTTITEMLFYDDEPFTSDSSEYTLIMKETVKDAEIGGVEDTFEFGRDRASGTLIVIHTNASRTKRLEKTDPSEGWTEPTNDSFTLNFTPTATDGLKIEYEADSVGEFDHTLVNLKTKTLSNGTKRRYWLWRA